MFSRRSCGSRFLAFAVAATLALTSGCGGGGGGGGGGTTGTVNLLVGDAPVDTLSSFTLTITSLTLRIGAGSTANLLGTPRTLDLLALATTSELLEVEHLPPGTYDGVDLSFDPATIVARDLAGVVIPVNATAGDVGAAFPAPITLASRASIKLHLEFPLATALTDDLAHPGELLFTPDLVPSERSGELEPIGELHGTLLSEAPGDRSLRVTLRELEHSTSLGNMTLLLSDTSVLLDENGDLFASEAAFFAFALAGDRIEAAGGLADDGTFHVDTLKIERDDGGAEKIARIDGTITSLDTVNQELALRIESVRYGSSVVDPILSGLGDPSEITIDYAGAKIRVGGGDPRGGDATDLAVGQPVEVEFTQFATSPFPAHEIELESEAPEFEGTTFDVSGLPGGFIVHLEDHDPAVLDGRVQDSSTDVSVVLDGGETIVLDLPGDPALTASQLQDGMRIRVEGVLSGAPTAPQIDAAALRVTAGRLRGTVTAVDEVGGTFTVDVTHLDNPFGGANLPDPVVVTFDANASVTRDAHDVASFFALFNGLGGGEQLDVEVSGIADGSGGALGFLVDAQVR